MILSRTRPSIYVSTLVVLWGAVAASMAAVQTPTQLILIRFVLGVFEAGFSPAVLFMISTWYRKSEHSKRFLCYLSAGILSGAFGGIIAGAISAGLDGTHGIAGWRWLFIVEGILTVSVGLMAPFFLLDYPTNCRKFTPAEREIACARLRADNISHTAENGRVGHWRTLWNCIMSWRIWLLAIPYMSVIGAFSFSYFYPMLVKGLGYTDVTAQFMTAPLYVVAFVVALPTAVLVDKAPAYRGLVCCGLLCFGSLFAGLAAGILAYTPRYVFLCFITAAVWTTSPVALGFASDILSNIDPEQRAVALALINSMANSATIYASLLYPSTDAPAYLKGFVTWTVLLAFGATLYVVAWVLFRRHPVRKIV
ncbi:hypothetical protein LTR84_012005 [Exophiala bonariae]|uniref:Major facilitator superfamily (MFS) profile domain-containing protein n=1 Tax=Exophiala bonariae TaxID=1690606 RepID=A0AAV9MRE1_9EURO|nr:hypothetical protein LTR84_012005 [Exophiala bonariae]